MAIKEEIVRQVISTIRNAPTLKFNAEEGVDEIVVANQDWLLRNIDNALAAGIPPDKIVITVEGRELKPNELQIDDVETLKEVLLYYREFTVRIDPGQATRHETDHNLGVRFRTAFHWIEERGQKEPRAQLSVSPDFQGEIALPDLLGSISAPQILSPVDERMYRKIIDLLDEHGFSCFR